MNILSKCPLHSCFHTHSLAWLSELNKEDSWCIIWWLTEKLTSSTGVEIVCGMLRHKWDIYIIPDPGSENITEDGSEYSWEPGVWLSSETVSSGHEAATVALNLLVQWSCAVTYTRPAGDKASQHSSMGERLTTPTPTRGTNSSQWPPGEGESVFFRGVAPSRLTML